MGRVCGCSNLGAIMNADDAVEAAVLCEGELITKALNAALEHGDWQVAEEAAERLLEWLRARTSE